MRAFLGPKYREIHDQSLDITCMHPVGSAFIPWHGIAGSMPGGGARG